MKKAFITIIAMLLPMLAMGQILLYEQDFTGVSEFTGWSQFDDRQTDGKVEVDPNGVAITVGIQTGQLWQPQVMVIPDGSFNLKEYGNYRVVVTAKFPTSGTLQMNMGTWSANDQAQFYVAATGGFQTVVCDFMNWSVDADGAHLLFHCGDFKGTTILKKIQVFKLEYGLNYNFNSVNKTAEVIPHAEGKYYGTVEIPSKVIRTGVEYTVTSIGSSAFEGCVYVTSVTIPSSVTTIGGAAFYYCTGLKTVDIPNGVKTIGEGAFSKCGGLTSVTIPGSVTSIGKNAFFQCYGLTQITSWIENPFAIDDGVFPSSVYTNASLLVPSGKKSAYQNTAGWKRFQNIIEPGVVVKEFEFNGIRYLIGENNTVSVISKTEKYAGAVSIPNQVSFNGNNYNVTSIGSSAFEGCTGLTSVTIPSSVTTIGGAAFYMCTGLTTVDIPNSVKTLGEGAFSKCGGLTSVTIPSSVTSIGKNAFFQCYGLTQITSGIENPFAIDDGVFPSSVYTNSSLLVPSGRKAAYQNTAGWKRFQNIIEPGVVVKEFEVNGIRYLIGENNTVSVISKTEKYAGAVSIPNQVSFNGNNYTVTSIGSSAFEGCTGLTSVTIPSSVTTIGGAAFYMCTGLTNIDIPNGVKTLGEGAFSKCGGLTSVTFPSSVTSIGKNAFFQCYGLTQVTSWIENPFAIDDGVFPTSVYNNASLLVPSGKKSAYQNTAGWKRFQNIIEPSVVGKEFEVDGIRYKIGENNTVSVVNREAKYSYSGDVVIPEQVTYNGATYSVTTIGFFGYCTGLLSVTIPPSIKSIAFDAFDECINLTAVNITDIASWCNISFASNYSNPLSKAHHLFLNGKEVTDLVIPNSVTTIKDYSFWGCSGLTSITIPNSVTKIGFGAFGWCSGLTTIVSEIANPFAIDDGFDKDIYATATLIVPPGKKSVYQNTAGWKKFKNIVEVGGVGYEFEANGVRYLIGENNTVSVISKTEKYTGAISIPNQVSFNGNNYTVTAIAQSAFEGCTGMTAVTIPNSVTTIGGAAFYYCTGLKTVDIPNGVKTIGEGAFSKCEGLTSVTIPGSVTSIGKNAFFQCYGLTQITSGIENPFAIDDSVFPTSVYNNASLLVPSGKKSAYQNTAGWKRFQNIVEASAVGKEFEANGVRYLIGENNTVSVISKTEKYAGAVSIPNQVSFNGNNYNVTSIAQSAFEGCIDMTSISIPGSVTTIGDAAFYYCTSLTTVDIPNGVKTIGEGAFSKCEGLTSVTIPGSVTSIGKNAFFQCYGLTQITSWIENPFAIDEGVFPTSVYNNASLLVPSGRKSAYQNTAGWKRFQNIYYVDGVYTLTYYVDGVEYKSVTYSSGAGITPEEEPTKEGYTFSGWIDIPETMPDHDVTVTGTFTINQYTITYVIDGEVYATVTVDFSSKIVPLTPPSKDGFDFTWEEYPETMPAHDITINGAYTTTGILSIAVESGKAKIFTLDGRQVDTLQKGINIIRMDDGTIKKVVLSK